MDAEKKPTEVQAPEEGYNRQEPNAPIIAGIGAAIVIVVVVVIVAVNFLFQQTNEHKVFLMQESTISQETLSLRAKEDADLYQYRFIDRQKGEVRLPIERAMELYVKEAAEGKFKYPTTPGVIKPETPDGQAPAPAGASPAKPATGAAPNATGKAD
ncbi:MAG TPA: hypothetical protein DEH78_28660 [Solibacterales bacterium]|nr:hypothetical protein [Bryobacterales bacterium]